jgi:hypothetical protein
MSTKREFGKYVFNGSAALLFTLSMMPLTVAADTEPFSGVATLCAISPEVVAPPEQKGKNGVLVKNNMTFIYLIKADSSESLMNGYEYQANNSKLTKSGIEFFTGYAEFIPNEYAETGAFVEDFKYKAEEIASGVSGTFTGTGALEGVTVDYTLSPPYPSAAVDFPPECFGYDATLCEYCITAYIPIDPENPNPVFPDDFIFMQYEISGWIEGYEP